MIEERAKAAGGTEGAGLPIALGALLDGLPESFVLGASLVSGPGVSVSFLVAVLLSNLPEGLVGARDLREEGHSERWIMGLWIGVAVASGISAAIGFAVLGSMTAEPLGLTKAFAAGAILTMLADTMFPGGRTPREARARAGHPAGFRAGILPVGGSRLTAVAGCNAYGRRASTTLKEGRDDRPMSDENEATPGGSGSGDRPEPGVAATRSGPPRPALIGLGVIAGRPRSAAVFCPLGSDPRGRGQPEPFDGVRDPEATASATLSGTAQPSASPTTSASTTMRSMDQGGNLLRAWQTLRP